MLLCHTEHLTEQKHTFSSTNKLINLIILFYEQHDIKSNKTHLLKLSFLDLFAFLFFLDFYSLLILLVTCRYILFAFVLNVTHTDILISFCAVKQIKKPDLLCPDLNPAVALCRVVSESYLNTKVPAVPWPSTSNGAKEILPTCNSSLLPPEQRGDIEHSRNEWNSCQLQVLCYSAVCGTLPSACSAPLVTSLSASEVLLLWL